MRVASVVTPVVAVLLAVLLAALAAGCSTSPTSRFCSTLTNSKLDFAQVADPAKEFAALDQVLAQLSPRDRRLVEPVRSYVQILYRRSPLPQKQQIAFLSHFFHVDAPALDRRLRSECNVPLDKRIHPFPVRNQATT